MSVNLPMYSGEDWVQSMTFYTDVAMTVPMALTHPQMDIRAINAQQLYAHLDITGTADGTLTISGGSSNILTITLPHPKTEPIPGGSFVRFDIFDDIAGVRTCIVKNGTITVSENSTVMA